MTGAAGHDPFETLGLDRTATLADLRAARRRLAFEHHPDRGGSAEEMRALNVAFDLAVGHVTGRRLLPDAAHAVPEPPDTPSPVKQRSNPHLWAGRVQYDAPSFVIDALPAEAFEALLVVSSWIGEVMVDDPPYLLDVHLYEPAECWCRLDIVPDAGASTISITVSGVDGAAAPFVDDVRDTWVYHLNQPGGFRADVTGDARAPQSHSVTPIEHLLL